MGWKAPPNEFGALGPTPPALLVVPSRLDSLARRACLAKFQAFFVVTTRGEFAPGISVGRYQGSSTTSYNAQDGSQLRDPAAPSVRRSFQAEGPWSQRRSVSAPCHTETGQHSTENPTTCFVLSLRIKNFLLNALYNFLKIAVGLQL